MLATSAGAAMGAAATEALLFANFDLAQLPVLYVALGVTTFAVTLVTSGLLAGGDRARVYVALPALLAAVVVAERLAAASGLGWVYAALWLGMNVVTTLQGIAAWGLAAAVCDVRQAKRLFPLFNAAKIAGTVAGSFAVTLAVRFVAVEELLVIWALPLGLAAIVAFALVYLAGFAAIAVSAAFAVLVAARFAQTVWLSGIADTAYQALFNPVPPERRDQIRAFMEGVPGQAGIALAGVALLLGDALDPPTVALGGVVASAITAWLMLRARAAYGLALADALRSGRPQPFMLEADPFGALRTDADALRVTVGGMRDTDPAVRRGSAGILRQLALPAPADALVAALGDDDEA